MRNHLKTVPTNNGYDLKLVTGFHYQEKSYVLFVKVFKQTTAFFTVFQLNNGTRYPIQLRNNKFLTKILEEVYVTIKNGYKNFYQVGDKVYKCSGSMHYEGEIRCIFPTKEGFHRLVLEIPVQENTKGFLHIHSFSDIVPLDKKIPAAPKNSIWYQGRLENIRIKFEGKVNRKVA